MFQYFLDFMRSFIPPKPWDGSHTFRFNLAVAFTAFCCWSVAALGFLWLIGRLSFLPQLAWASDVQAVASNVGTVRQKEQEIDNKLTGLQLLSISNNIDLEYKEACMAQRMGNQSDLDSANAMLRNLQDWYYRISGRYPILPANCSTVLITK